MGVDLTPEALASGSSFEMQLEGWIKCARCTERLKRTYCVETMEVEGADTARVRGSRYRMVVKVECHGESMRCAIEIPTWWGESMRMQVLSYVYAFVGGTAGSLYTCEVRRGRKGQSPGGLVTEVQ